MFPARYFCAVYFAPRYWCEIGATPTSSHSIYRLDQPAAGGDLYRETSGGSSDIYRTPPPAGGKLYR